MRWAAGVEYDGTAFHGWEAQQGEVRTVQAAVEQGLSIVADQPVLVTVAGRTDAGVHAIGQVIHFDTEVERDPHAWLRGVNSNLPEDVRLRWVQLVSDDFHARYSATARTYRYGVLSGPAASALLRDHLAWTWKSLDVEAMQAGANHLLGEQDFSAFRAAACQAQHARREVQAVHCWRQGAVVWFEVRANAFLHHMVRNFMGSLLEVAAGEHSPEWIAELLETRDRTQAGATADAAGLYLVEVDYPASFELPRIKNGAPESLPWPPVFSL